MASLQIAWSYDTGERGSLQTNPVIVDGVLYGFTPAEGGLCAQCSRWKRHLEVQLRGEGNRPARAISIWREDNERRVFAGIASYLYALDLATGKPIPSFGTDGRIDLREGLIGDPKLSGIDLTSPGVIYKDLIIMGGAQPEALPAAPGDIRAFDCRSSKLRWVFHTIPHPGEFGYDTWPRDAWQKSCAANNWAGMTVDVQRGIVYVPTVATTG